MIYTEMLGFYQKVLAKPLKSVMLNALTAS